MESQVVCLRVLSAFVQLGDSVNISLVSYIPSVCPGLIDWPVQDGSRLLSIVAVLSSSPLTSSPRLSQRSCADSRISRAPSQQFGTSPKK